jgi:hypothetical protein
MTRKFLDWFYTYGILDESISVYDSHKMATLRRVAWRAYRRGGKDMLEKIEGKLEPIEFD